MRTSSGFTVTSEIIIALFHFFSLNVWNGRSMKFFFFIFFFEKGFPKKKKKEDPSTNDFSYQKYINGSMATQKDKTHIQYPNIYKLYVSINYIYTKNDFFT